MGFNRKGKSWVQRKGKGMMLEMRVNKYDQRIMAYPIELESMSEHGRPLIFQGFVYFLWVRASSLGVPPCKPRVSSQPGGATSSCLGGTWLCNLAPLPGCPRVAHDLRLRVSTFLPFTQSQASNFPEHGSYSVTTFQVGRNNPYTILNVMFSVTHSGCLARCWL